MAVRKRSNAPRRLLKPGCCWGDFPTGRVGKTSILLRYVRGEYSDKQQSTLQASYLDKRLVAAGTSTHLSIWDTAGQERFHSLGPIYYRDAGEK